MNKLVKTYIILLPLLFFGCGKLKHQVEGGADSHVTIDAPDTTHHIYYGIDPETLDRLVEICENQDKVAVDKCLERLLKPLEKEDE